jgi:hypothetical protein
MEQSKWIEAGWAMVRGLCLGVTVAGLLAAVILAGAVFVPLFY